MAELENRYRDVDDTIIEIDGLLSLGEFWLRLGPFDLVPPTLAHSPDAFCASMKPVPEELIQWRSFFEAHPGPHPVLTCAHLKRKKLRAYQLTFKTPVPGWPITGAA